MKHLHLNKRGYRIFLPDLQAMSAKPAGGVAASYPAGKLQLEIFKLEGIELMCCIK